MMNIPQEFEEIFRGIALTDGEIRTLVWISGLECQTVENLRSAIQKAQATALSTLQAENKRLNKIVCSIPTTPDSGRTVSQYDKEMSMCAYLDDLEAETEKLRAELEQKSKLITQQAEELERRDTLLKEQEDELEQAKAERDAAVNEVERVIERYVPLGISPDDVDFGVDKIPAADVAPVRHGRWESNGPDDIVVYCSQCMMPQDAPSNYCPSCGALMDKEDEHEAD